MKRGRFTETQIVSILKEADAGLYIVYQSEPVPLACK